MTREEAKLKIEWIRDGNDFTPTDAQVIALDMAIEALKDKPMAKGEWIDSKTARGYVACSNCNKLTTNINRKKYNYCPFCGADVRSGVM